MVPTTTTVSIPYLSSHQTPTFNPCERTFVMDVFYRWLESHRVVRNVSVCKVNSNPTGSAKDPHVHLAGDRGLVADRKLVAPPISRGPSSTVETDINTSEDCSLLFQIPRHLLITAQSSCESDPNLASIIGNLPEELKEYQESISIMLFLIHHRIQKENSMFFPYISVLPRTYTSTIHFNEEEMKTIQGTPLEYLTHRIHDELVENFQVLYQHIEKFCPNFFSFAIRNHQSDGTLAAPSATLSVPLQSALTFEHFLWAFSTVESRAFRLSIQETTVTVVAPLADMANHSPSGSHFHRRYDEESKSFKISIDAGCAKAYDQGQEIFLQYGSLSNWQLMLYYGFCLEDNPYESIDIRLEEPSQSENFDLDVKKALLLNLNSEWLRLDHSISLQPADPARTGAQLILSDGLLASLRLLLLTPTEAADINVQNVFEKLKNPVSRENEANVFQTLKNLFEYMIPSFRPESIDYEQAQTIHGNIASVDPVKVLAGLRYRRGQLKILKVALEWINQEMINRTWIR